MFYVEFHSWFQTGSCVKNLQILDFSASYFGRRDEHKHAQSRRQNRWAENLVPWAAIKISTHQAPRALAREGTHKKSCIFQQNSMKIQVSNASQGLMGCDFFSGPEKTNGSASYFERRDEHKHAQSRRQTYAKRTQNAKRIAFFVRFKYVLHAKNIHFRHISLSKIVIFAKISRASRVFCTFIHP